MNGLLILSTYFLAIVFLFAGIDKIFHYDGFVSAVSSYALVPQGVASYIAAPLIVAEIFAGLGLPLRQWRKAAASLAMLLLTLFTVALIFNHFVQPGSICGCWFTVTLAKGTGVHILQNLALLGLAISIACDLRYPQKDSSPSTEKGDLI